MIVAIGRAKRFSPNSVSKDAAILESVANKLAQRGYGVDIVNEETSFCYASQVFLSMGRDRQTIKHLAIEESKGAIVINSSASIALCCNRRKLFHTLEGGGIPVPASVGNDGYWLKRGDGCAETSGDVRFAADEKEKERVRKEMESEGMTDIVVQAHERGDLVKLYGVRGTTFFRIFYPGDDGQTKFGDEKHNGRPHHYPFNVDELREVAEEAASIVGVDVYGGDCIVRDDGTFCLIDFNDWPSFSRCREDAATAIAQLTLVKLEDKLPAKQFRLN